MLREPESSLLLSSGTGRHWPDGRGVFQARDEGFVAWVNEEDHLQLIVRRPDDNFAAALERFARANETLRDALRKASADFACDSAFGYLTSCPSNLGSAFKVTARCRLPLLSNQDGFKKLGNRLRVGIAGNLDDCAEGVVDICSATGLGCSESEQVVTVARAVAELCRCEDALERGQAVPLDSIGA